MLIIVDILTFISIINCPSKRLKAIKVFAFQHLSLTIHLEGSCVFIMSKIKITEILNFRNSNLTTCSTCIPTMPNEPYEQKTCLWGLRQGNTQTNVVSYRDKLDIEILHEGS